MKLLLPQLAIYYVLILLNHDLCTKCSKNWLLTWLRRKRIVRCYWRRRRRYDSTFRFGNQKYDAILSRLQGRHSLFVCHVLQIFIALLKSIWFNLSNMCFYLIVHLTLIRWRSRAKEIIETLPGIYFFADSTFKAMPASPTISIYESLEIVVSIKIASQNIADKM